MLILSIFPGIDLLGKGFEQVGFCVVRGPDLIWGGDIRTFAPPPDKFEGVIGGSPCPDFSKLRRAEPSGYGLEMIAEFKRVVRAARPVWWLLENVPGVPDVQIDGYSWQRLDLKATEFGLTQSRLRHFQFGSRDAMCIILDRWDTVPASQPCATATEGSDPARRTWADFCELQGLPRDFNLPGMTQSGRYRAVGNGVPLPMARGIARAIKERKPIGSVRPCVCGCGRSVTGKAKAAKAACRKRVQRRRDRTGVTFPGTVTAITAQIGSY